MKRTAITFLILLLFGITSGCGGKNTASVVPRPGAMAVMTIDDEQQMEMEPDEGEILDGVVSWLDQDIIHRLRDEGLKISVLRDLRKYSSSMGPLVIISVEAFNPGVADKQPRGAAGKGVASLALGYKLFDERGALLTEWQDGAESSKGANYCARDLNLRAMEKITAALNLR